ncbi:MAG: A/G-specific adenine glycosylase [Crocinitomicaceae bacterium]|nr:A/G-specific adenine glycosylase [Crocinitomicaceae bacterium]
MKILNWYDQNQRDLPWRATKNPYKIWLSEIILQQTRVEQGRSYYEKFVLHYPTVQDLAQASEDQVLKLWEGLGYYSRGRNLLATAKIIAIDYNGEFPNNANDLKKLKGIGPYTSAAISSISNNERIAAVDGNAFRVLSRFFDIEKDISLNTTRKYFEKLMTELIEGNRPGDFNQAVMDLGASICTPKNYQCETCPLNYGCIAFEKKQVDQRPVKTKKLKIKDRYLHFLLIFDSSKIALERREEGIWKGLYQFPLIEMETNNTASSDLIKSAQIPIENAKLIQKNDSPHKLSHQNLFISFWKVDSKGADLKYDLEELEKLSFPKPLKTFIEGYFSEVNI